SDPGVVRATGGVPWRRRADGDLEVLVVHRPKYDDWSFPKDKAEPDEDNPACALREVAEETGLRCELGSELATARYRDRAGRSKVVRFWSMRPLDGEFQPGREVDEVRWVDVEEARRLLDW